MNSRVASEREISFIYKGVSAKRRYSVVVGFILIAIRNR